MSERLDMLAEQWAPSSGISVSREGSALIVENSANERRTVSLRFPMRVALSAGASFTVRIAGEAQSGSGFGVVAQISDVTHYPMPLNSWNRFTLSESSRVMLTLEVGARSSFRLTEFWVEQGEPGAHLFSEHIELDDTLIVTPTYPSSNHLYLAGFVHSRIVGYQREGLRPVVLCAFDAYEYQSVYEFEGVRVLRGDLTDLLAALNQYRFTKIGVHFFDEHYALALDRAAGNRDAEIVLWCHGPETLFYDLPAVNGPYFTKPRPAEGEQLERFQTLHRVMRSFEKRQNVRWIFVSEWMRQRSRHLLGLPFERSDVIHNTIDTGLFKPVAKSADAARRVLMIRRYDDERKYAVDLAVEAIVELSRRPIFKDLEFTIVGDGPSHGMLFEPLKRFTNVTYVRRFANHQEIAELHRSHGTALFPTRYDSQGVSACEAAASGLVVISSDSSAISEFIPASLGTLAPENSALGLADALERIVSDPALHERTSKQLSAHIASRCSRDATIVKEVELLRRPLAPRRVPPTAQHDGRVTLTVGVPVYNMERLLSRCLTSILAGEPLEGLEVLVVDDGSKDGSLAVARSFEARFPGVVRVIAKENGGHGSVLNRVLAEAKGRYLRIIDSDDWVDPVNFAAFLEQLHHEDVDVVITDYAEDWAHRDELLEKPIYENIQPGAVHTFDLLANERYGFRSWGPVLATASFKTECLRRAGLRIDEKIAYVDMEYCTLSLTYIETVKYLELSVYRYFLGRPDQTVERSSFEKKHAQHEQVIMRIAEYVNSAPLSDAKRAYIVRNVLKPLIASHRMVIGDWLADDEKLRAFDEAVLRFPALSDVPTPPMRLHPLVKASRQMAQVLRDSVKLALPYRFVAQLTPHFLKDRREAAKYALEYFTPTIAVKLMKDVKAGRAYWYEGMVGPASRLVGRFGESTTRR